MSSSHLTNLSPELHLSIISYLSLSDKRLLRCVCQLFNNLLFLDLPLEDLRAAKKNNTILLIENASKGKLGFEPFIIMNVRKIRSDLDEPKSAVSSAGAPLHGGRPGPPSSHILLDIYYAKYMQNWDGDDDSDAEEEEEDDSDDEDEDEDEDKEYEEYDAWEITIDMKKLSLDSSGTMPWKSTRRVKSINYDSMRGKLIKASAGLLRSRFVCPECRNGRNVCPGCGGFSQRFPDLFTSCGVAMPCPICIGYGPAYDAKDMQDDEEEMNKLWEEIDEMLDKEKGAEVA